jgi:hypothetical protein
MTIPLNRGEKIKKYEWRRKRKDERKMKMEMKM